METEGSKTEHSEHSESQNSDKQQRGRSGTTLPSRAPDGEYADVADQVQLWFKWWKVSNQQKKVASLLFCHGLGM